MKKRSKKHKPEEIVHILRQGEGPATIQEVCRKHNITEQTYYRWRRQYGGMGVKELKRLKTLEQENSQLKKLLGETMMEKQAMKELLEKKW